MAFPQKGCTTRGSARRFQESRGSSVRNRHSLAIVSRTLIPRHGRIGALANETLILVLGDAVIHSRRLLQSDTVKDRNRTGPGVADEGLFGKLMDGLRDTRTPGV